MKKRNRTVIHVVTIVQTMLQVADDKGDVVEQFPLEQRIRALSRGEFVKAHAAVEKSRQRIIAGLPPVEPTPAALVESVPKGKKAAR